jgi:hypothetical protein
MITRKVSLRAECAGYYYICNSTPGRYILYVSVQSRTSGKSLAPSRYHAGLEPECVGGGGATHSGSKPALYLDGALILPSGKLP